MSNAAFSNFSFAKYMNEPEIDVVGNIDGEWVRCPFCGCKNLKINEHTKISDLWIKCKGSNCKKEFLVEVDR